MESMLYRAAGERMGATIVEVPGGSHSTALSQPDKVTDIIMDAVKAVS
jgi:pimeloyl-ACP methyl ester carboxylesterase